MKRRRLTERRQDSRYVLSAPFRGQELSVVGTRQSSRRFEGRIHNISAGGVKLVTSRRTKSSALIRGEFLMPNVPIGVPSLMQVRWIQRAGASSRYEIGLQFLL